MQDVQTQHGEPYVYRVLFPRSLREDPLTQQRPKANHTIHPFLKKNPTWGHDPHWFEVFLKETLVQSWCKVGAKLVHSWCKVWGSFSCTCKVVGVKTLHQECTKNAPTLHQLFTKNAPTLHQLFTKNAPTLHQFFTKNAPTFHQQWTKHAPTFHSKKSSTLNFIFYFTSISHPTLQGNLFSTTHDSRSLAQRKVEDIHHLVELPAKKKDQYMAKMFFFTWEVPTCDSVFLLLIFALWHEFCDFWRGVYLWYFLLVIILQCYGFLPLPT